MEKSIADSGMVESMGKWFTTGESLLAMIFALAALFGCINCNLAHH